MAFADVFSSTNSAARNWFSQNAPPNAGMFGLNTGQPTVNGQPVGGVDTNALLQQVTQTAQQGASGQPYTDVASYVKWLSQQPGADPTLASDPNYWIGKINETGGLTSGNIGYWNTRSKAGAGSVGGASGGSDRGSLIAPYGSFTPPTDLANDPATQAALKLGSQAIQQSAAAKGTLLTGGTLEDLANYGINTVYPQAFNNALATYSTNAGNYYTGQNNQFNRLNTIYNQGFNAVNATTQ